MTEIEFSILLNDLADIEHIQPLLIEFEKRQSIKVTLTPILWREGWAKLANMALYGQGPDVSEIGTTWISSFAAMNALRPFGPEEVAMLGGANAFLPVLWRTGILPGDTQIWAIPWVAFTQLLYYRKQPVEKAGLSDVAAAFADLNSFNQTLERFFAKGLQPSLGLTAYHFPPVVHEAASWIWSNDGDFLDGEGKRVIFNEPRAIQGLHALFSLGRFLVPPSSPPRAPVTQVVEGDAIVGIDGPYYALQQQRLPAAEQLGITPVPGVPCIGGSSLIIWKHSRRSRAALELVKFLSHHVPQAIRLPARRRILQVLAEQDAFYQLAWSSLERGLTFPTVRLWGAIEERLITELVTVWTEVLANPNADLDMILHRQLDPLARKLNLMLAG